MSTSKAIWSKKFNGFYLPDGYRINNDHRKEKAFFVLTGGGRFSNVPLIPKIEYADRIEEREKAIYAPLMEKMPQNLIPMFAAP